MLKFYLATVIIWMIIICCVILIFQKGIVDKFGKNKYEKISFFKVLKALFVLAAVPFVRLFIVIFIIYISICKQEDFDKLMEATKRD